MVERDILRKDVKHVISEGEIIEEYLEDEPYPSFLLYNCVNNRPIHVLIAYDDTSNMVYVITVYEPDSKHFELDNVTRRR